MTPIEEAIDFAAFAHRGQKWRQSKIPFFVHPFAVGMILQEARCEEQVVVAGILHHTLRDTDTAKDELIFQFGIEVVEIVKGVPRTYKGASWDEKKRRALDYLENASLPLRLVTCADCLHHIRRLKDDLERVGDDAWLRFKRGHEGQRWYYYSLVESLGRASHFDLLDRLQKEVDEAFGQQSSQ